jgi:HEAT repeat protein
MQEQIMYETQRELNDGQDLPTDWRLDSLVAAFASHDVATRQNARHALVSIGEGAVNSLIKALQDRQDQVRWEAAKALVDIASPKAAPALVVTLRDEEGGIRWLAAEALVALGPSGLEPLLQGLIDNSRSPFIRAGAHHILHELVPGPCAELVLPVLVALEGPVPENRAPIAAYAALATLRNNRVLATLRLPHARIPGPRTH